MDYSNMELIYYFFVYSFIGWGLEVAYHAIRTGRLGNCGLFNLPLCPSYGVTMILLISFIPSMNGNLPLQILGTLLIVGACVELTYIITGRMTGNAAWSRGISSISEDTSRAVEVIVMSVLGAIGVLLIHPFVFLTFYMIPYGILKIALWVLCGLLVADGIILHLLLRRKPVHLNSLRFISDLESRKESLANRITLRVWKRLLKVYPFLTEDMHENEIILGQTVFAKGVGLYKLFWVFFVTAILGDIIETFYCRIVGGTWMLRSSVLYGPFSFVWGIGAALLTLILYRLAKKPVRLFIGGFFLGGTYEYMASLILEIVTGTKFWDYSYMMFNIDGRTNLLFCFFWGLLALVWVKLLYPVMSHFIEMIPPLPGAVLTWILIVLMVLDLGISGAAIVRYTERQKDPAVYGPVQQFLDYHYPDSMIQHAWPNMIVVEEQPEQA